MSKTKKIVKSVEETVNEVVTDVKAEANEDVATFTIDRWHVALAAVVVTAVILIVAL